LADVHAVGAAPFDEIRAVVQDEERAVVVTGAPERCGRDDEILVGEILVAKLDDVDAAAQRCVEQIGGILPVRAPLEHEIEPRAGEPCASGGAVHGG
jgi:hypothetical protein